MSESFANPVVWLDLTVENAEQLTDFYSALFGWQKQAIAMKDTDGHEYHDYAMIDAESGEPVAGICHAKGSNQDLPPVWLNYFKVDNVQQAVDASLTKGGKLIRPIQAYGKDNYAVIMDPAGAYFAVYGA